MRLIKDGKKVGEGGAEVGVGGGGSEILYLSLHCHHQSDSCMKVGSDENRFKVS